MKRTQNLKLYLIIRNKTHPERRVFSVLTAVCRLIVGHVWTVKTNTAAVNQTINELWMWKQVGNYFF